MIGRNIYCVRNIRDTQYGCKQNACENSRLQGETSMYELAERKRNKQHEGHNLLRIILASGPTALHTDEVIVTRYLIIRVVWGTTADIGDNLLPYLRSLAAL